MRLLKVSCYKMLKVIVFSMLCLLSICIVGCNKRELKEEHTHTKVHVLKIEPSCISEGRLEYWFCSQCNKVYKDKDAEYEITWEETKLPKTEHIFVEDEERPATCEEEGLSLGKHCSYCNLVIEQQTKIDALGHNYEYDKAVWKWDDFQAANFVVPCKNNEEHKKTYQAEVTKTVVPATCTDAGKNTYVASVMIEGVEYQDQKEEVILPLEHDFDLENISWSWDEDKSASAQIPCKNDTTHTLTCDATLKEEILPVSCTANGKKTIIATISIQGQEYKTVKEFVLVSTGHAYDYENIQWQWEGTSKATARITCKNDKEHQITYDAVISTNIVAPTCDEDGKRTYTATILVANQSYTDEKVETIEHLGHDFDYTSYTWEWNGYKEASLSFLCKNDSSHLDSYSAQILTNTVLPTCVAEGKITYTASVILYAQSYVDEKEVVLPIDSNNHAYNYTEPLWIWQPIVDGYHVSAQVTCSCGESTLSFVAEDIEIDLHPATFDAAGQKEYRAKTLIEGNEYEDYRVENLPIKQYVNSEEEFLLKIQEDSYDLTLTKDLLIKEEVILEGNYASIDLKGHILSISDSKFIFKATHSYIQNGYLEADFDQIVGSYALKCEDNANILIEDVFTLGGISISHSKALIRNVDLTGASNYTIYVEKEGLVQIEDSIIKKNYTKSIDAFLYISKEEENFKSSEIYIGNGVKFVTTSNAILYSSTSMCPTSQAEVIIEYLDIKEYLLSYAEYKCLSLNEDLIFENEELQKEKIIIEGKHLILELNEHTLAVPEGTLVITTSLARVENGNIELSSYEDSSSAYVITIINGCKALIHTVQIVGSIKTDNSSVTLKDVVINSPEFNH